MRFELTHDTIAKQVYEKSSVEAKQRRKIEAYIKNKHELYQKYKYLLTQDDIDYIVPFLESIRLSKAEEAFIEASQSELNRKKRRRRNIVTGVISILLIATAFSIFQWRTALHNQRLAEGSAFFNQGQLEAVSDPTQGIKTMYEGYQLTNDKLYLDKIYETYEKNILYYDLIHTAPYAINDADFSPDGRYAAVIFRDHSGLFIYDWEKKNKLPLDSLIGAGNELTVVKFSPDGKKVLVGGHDRRAQLWDLETRTPMNFPKTEADLDDPPVTAIDFSYDGQFIAVAHESDLRYWSIENNESPVYRKQLESKIKSLRFDFIDRSSSLKKDFEALNLELKDSLSRLFHSTLANHSRQEEINISFNNYPLLREKLIGHQDTIINIKTDLKERYLYSASRDSTLRKWKNKNNYSLKAHHSGTPKTMAFDNNKGWVADTDGRLHFFDDDKMKQKPEPYRKKLSNLPITTIAISKNGTFGICGNQEGQIYKWTIQNDTIHKIEELHKASHSINDLVLSPNGNFLFFAVKNEEVIRSFNLSNQQITSLIGHEDKRGVLSLALSNDGQYLVSTDTKNTAILWDLDPIYLSGKPGQLINKFLHLEKQVVDASFDNEANYIYTVTNKKKIYQWSTTPPFQKNMIPTQQDIKWIYANTEHPMLFTAGKKEGFQIRELNGAVLQAYKIPIHFLSVNQNGTWIGKIEKDHASITRNDRQGMTDDLFGLLPKK